MIAVEVHREIALPADVVWEEIRHFDRVLHWIPGGETSRINVRGEGVGAVRDIHLSTQGYVQHRLVEYDNSKRSFSYELTAGKPIGMQDYVVVASVVPLDAGRCTLSWSGRMSADSTLNEEAVGDALKVALSNMTTGIIARLSGEQPNFERQPNEDWQLRQQGRPV
ncbi:MAG: SRPBCC family protein [Pseudomonadales bacterium]|nr:SRPBCC family protein [Pseudomonadales bacterium]